jgi:hypothetical protein
VFAGVAAVADASSSVSPSPGRFWPITGELWVLDVVEPLGSADEDIDFVASATGSSASVSAGPVNAAAGNSPLETASSNPTKIVSIGTLPKNPIPFALAIFSPPPLPKQSDISPQHGHTYPDIFSTRPITGNASLRVKDSDLTVSFRAVVCGVVIRMEDGVVGLEEVGVNRGWRWVIRDMCSSDVPEVSSHSVRLV